MAVEGSLGQLIFQPACRHARCHAWATIRSGSQAGQHEASIRGFRWMSISKMISAGTEVRTLHVGFFHQQSPSYSSFKASSHRLVRPGVVVVGVQPDAGRAAVLRQLPNVLVQAPVQALLPVLWMDVHALYPPVGTEA